MVRVHLSLLTQPSGDVEELIRDNLDEWLFVLLSLSGLFHFKLIKEFCMYRQVFYRESMICLFVEYC